MSDDTAFATKGDLKGIAQNVTVIVEAIGRIEKTLINLREADDQILTVLANVDERLTGKVEDYGARIVRLEKAAA